MPSESGAEGAVSPGQDTIAEPEVTDVANWNNQAHNAARSDPASH